MSEVKIYTLEDVAQHNTEDDLWMVINGKVYDCTKFLPEHPGGEEVVIDCGGTDATDAFEDIGHSEEAREQLEPLYIGDLDPASVPVKVVKSSSGSSDGGSQLPLIITLLVALLAAVAYYVLVLQKK